MYNTVLGALPLQQNGRAFYQSDYGARARKVYFDGYGLQGTPEWPCCSGTLPQVAADYGISAYFTDQQGIYVNLYVPSTLSWGDASSSVELSQSGNYPREDTVNLIVKCARPRRFTIRLRIPAWVSRPRVEVNDKPVSSPAPQPGSFFSLLREWRSGDRITLQLPATLELKAIDSEHPDTVALVRGPLALFALTSEAPKLSRAQLLAAERTPDARAWNIDTSNGSIRMVPFYEIQHELYSLYLDVV